MKTGEVYYLGLDIHKRIVAYCVKAFVVGDTTAARQVAEKR